MKKLILILPALLVISSCRYMFAVPPPTTKEYDEAWNKCYEKFMKEYQDVPDDLYEDWSPIIDPYFDKCMKEQGDPTEIDWYRVLTD